MKCKSLWYVAPHELDIREISLHDPGPHEVLVRIKMCGVCTWDLLIFSGGYQKSVAYPFYFGHEGVGIVEKIGAGVSRVSVGELVALRQSAVIGVNGGGHLAEYALQTETEVIPLPKDGRPYEYWLVEPVACCLNAVDLACIPPGARVALIGCGFMGSIILQILAMSPLAAIDVFDLRSETLEYAKSMPGGCPIDVHFSGKDSDFSDLDNQFDVVIETAGVELAFLLANKLVRKGGKFVIFSRQHQPFVFDFANWHSRGITVLNTSPAAAPDFTDCFYRSIPLLKTGRINLAPLITHIARPEEAQLLYEDGLSKANGYIKGVIRWEGFS